MLAGGLAGWVGLLAVVGGPVLPARAGRRLTDLALFSEGGSCKKLGVVWQAFWVPQIAGNQVQDRGGKVETLDGHDRACRVLIGCRRLSLH